MSLPFGERERCVKKGYNQWRKHRWVWDSQKELDVCGNCGAMKKENGVFVQAKKDLTQPSYARHKRERWAR